ncbi:hypothetical protein Taro_019850 [Colocasia esculenta]|uniref:SHSP domain-containing protein n=1 Tax=Colocasia esculenta TaxID=4460 RepID=A0A843V0H9_COLES|nr:hypothetical protein [Colocasia esculenta]
MKEPIKRSKTSVHISKKNHMPKTRNFWELARIFWNLIEFPPRLLHLHINQSLPTHLFRSVSELNKLPSEAPAKMSLIPSFFGNRSSVFDPFSMDVWDPFQAFPFGNTSSLPLSRRGWDSDTSAFAAARIDWKETPEAHVFKADLPGVNKEEVKVEVEEGRILQISGERSKEKEEKTDTWRRVERSSGSFRRRFRLPENARVDQVRASMENGVLTVTVPKEAAKQQPEVRTIEISG